MKHILFIIPTLMLLACGAQPYPPTKNFPHSQPAQPDNKSNSIKPDSDKPCTIQFENSMSLEDIAESSHLMRTKCNLNEAEVVSLAQEVFGRN